MTFPTVSFQDVDRAVWTRVHNLVVIPGVMVRVFQAQRPHDLPDIPDGTDVHIVVKKLDPEPIHSKKGIRAAVHGKPGTDFQFQLPNGETVTRFTEYEQAERPDWFVTEYRVAYLTRAFDVDRAVLRLIMKALPLRGWMDIVTGVRAQSTFSPPIINQDILEGQDSHFSKVLPWRLEHPINDFSPVDVAAVSEFSVAAEDQQTGEAFFTATVN